jgi:tRNA G26 N,N-dimethylase Trm1
LRSVRYCKEIDSIQKLVANDLDPKAVELMNNNFEYNDIDTTLFETKNLDAIHLMN